MMLYKTDENVNFTGRCVLNLQKTLTIISTLCHNRHKGGLKMIVEDTKDLVETDDYVVIEATLSEGDLLFVQIAVGIRNEVGDIVRIIPISTNPI